MNQYTSVGDVTYTHDANGNMVGREQPSGNIYYDYDYDNRLVEVVTPSQTINFKYDPYGKRIEKDIDGTITNYLYDGDQVITEYDGTGVLLRKFIYGPGIDEPILMDEGANTYYYHYDGLGSVTEITDSNGVLVERYEYDIYGKVTIKDSQDNILVESSVSNPYYFTGRRFDLETGLYYYRARYYDPELGRFLTTDPIEYEGGINLYTYVYNDPVNFIDPTGMSTTGRNDVEKQIEKQRNYRKRVSKATRKLVRKSAKRFGLGIVEGVVLTLGGAAIGSAIAPGPGTAAGATIGGAIATLHTLRDIGRLFDEMRDETEEAKKERDCN